MRAKSIDGGRFWHKATRLTNEYSQVMGRHELSCRTPASSASARHHPSDGGGDVGGPEPEDRLADQAGDGTGAAPDETALRDKVCAVDDSRMILNVYRAVLNELNFAPVLFQEPKKALAWLKEEQPLLICTDLNMPEMTGLDFIRKVRTLYSKEELPMVLVTTQDDRKDNEEAMEVGANAVLRKPFDAASLAAVLMQVFGDR